MMRPVRNTLVVLLALLCALGSAPAWPTEAEEENETPNAAPPDEEVAETEPVLFERLRVIDEPVEKIPGSVTYVGEEELQRQKYADIHRTLRLVPGLNMQEEEGYGLRPNIGMRGSGSERSSKITVLEDGILVAPAPYSAPAAYYFPTAGRMEGIEVRKGSSSIQQGPLTNGGVLNLMSSRIPSEMGGGIEMALAQDDTLRGRARVGSSTARFGWLVETYQLRTDGFKQLDNGGTTGFDLEDYLVKLRYTTGARAGMFQAVELKLGRTLQDGDETYLGLTDDDFRDTPFRRYAGSQRDHIDSDHEQIQLNYLVRPGPKLDLTTTLYRNVFFRNWRKLQSVQGVGITDVLSDPASHAAPLAVLRGETDSADDELMLRNNRRDYYSHGLQTLLSVHVAQGAARHDVQVGVRYHEDGEDRFQEEDGFAMRSGSMLQTSAGVPASQSNRISSANAWALFVRDTVSVGRWTFAPGLRVEWIDFERRDYGRNDPGRTGSDLSVKTSDVTAVIPGFGVSYVLGRANTLFAGVHRGFAPPGPGADQGALPEESVNWELGWRRNAGPLSSELVGFYNDYENLLGVDTLSSGGSGEGDLFNGGKARVGGVEASVGYDFGAATDLRYSLPFQFSYTYTETEFRTTFETDFDGWGNVVHAGDEMPYVPRQQAALAAGVVDPSWSVFLNAAWVSPMRTLAGQGAIPEDEATGAPLIVDLTGNYQLREGLKLFLQLRNLTNEAYVVARRPAGARPGLPRTVLAGVTWDF